VGHTIIMEEAPPPPPQKNLNEKFHNTRSVGKPRTRWENVVQTGPRNTRLEEMSWGLTSMGAPLSEATVKKEL
jgi:hypothetical protein